LRHSNTGLLSTSSDADCASGCPAVDAVLRSPQHLAFAPDGQLYVVESDADVSRVRAVDTDGMVRAYIGTEDDGKGARGAGKTGCICPNDGPPCSCYDDDERLATHMKLGLPTAVTVTPDDVVHVADMDHLRVHSIVPPVPAADPRTGRFQVLDAYSGQMYTFNRYGQHVSSSDLVTGQVIYSFTYSVNSYYGRLMKV